MGEVLQFDFLEDPGVLSGAVGLDNKSRTLALNDWADVKMDGRD